LPALPRQKCHRQQPAGEISGLGGDISTAVKDASDIKAAQDAYKKAQKGGS
jgi:hypothetical protein